jgi:hypothetical protein
MLVADRRSYSHDERVAALTGEALRHVIAREQSQAGAEAGGGEARDALRLASQHAVHWVLRDPAGAREWVDRLPESEAKLWAQKNMARAWADYDPDAVARWVETVSAESRAEVERMLSGYE